MMNLNLENLLAKNDCNNKLQEMVNQVPFDQAKTLILAIAMSAHAEFPQYENHWDDWIVVEINQDVVTKAGQAFVKGDRVLMEPPSKAALFGNFGAFYYSIRNGMDTLLPNGRFS